MPFGNMCNGLECTKACLSTRIIKHVEKNGYLPTIMSPCIHSPGAPYWIWTNRYQGDLVVVDVNAPQYPHLNTKWEVSPYFSHQGSAVLTTSRNRLSIFRSTLSLRWRDGQTLEVTSLIWHLFSNPGATRHKPNFSGRSS